MNCYGTQTNFTVCLPAAEPTSYDVNAPTDFSTDTDCTFIATTPQGPALCVRAATTINIMNALTVTGTRPLVLLGVSSINVTGTIDVASHRGSPDGPGANSSACAVSTDGTAADNGGAGGGGGSFGTKGGDGGNGDGGASAKGTAGATTAATFLRGGCPGGHGGAGGAGATGGAGGDGGGAVYLLSGGTLTISGTINASGAGATASPKPTANNGGGAGGGGSGGMIALFAGSSLTVTGATLFANGGGGAEGGDRPNDPDPGDDPLTAAAGGLKGAGNCNAGGDGGNGAAGTGTGSPGSQGNEGGGGGGGGVGAIRVLSGQSLSGALAVSPPAT